jgi:hypothetical protein
MSVANNQLRSIDGQNTLICDSIDINEEIILGGDNGNIDDVIFSDGTNARWRHISTILVAGDGIDISASQVISTDLRTGSGLTITATELDLANIPNSALTSSTISGRALGTNLQNLTAGSNLSFSVGSTYNGGTALTLNATNNTYTAGDGLTLGGGSGDEFSTDLDNLTAGTNISFSSGTTYDGLAPITISSTDTNTTYTAGEGLNLSGTTFTASGYLPSNVDYNSGMDMYSMAVLPSMGHSTDNAHTISNSGGVDDGWLKVSGHSIVFNIKIPNDWEATHFYMSLFEYTGGSYVASSGSNMYVSSKSNLTMADTPTYNGTKTDNTLVALSPVIITDLGEMMNIEINGIGVGDFFTGGGYIVISKT